MPDIYDCRMEAYSQICITIAMYVYIIMLLSFLSCQTCSSFLAGINNNPRNVISTASSLLMWFVKSVFDSATIRKLNVLFKSQWFIFSSLDGWTCIFNELLQSANNTNINSEGEDRSGMLYTSFDAISLQSALGPTCSKTIYRDRWTHRTINYCLNSWRLPTVARGSREAPAEYRPSSAVRVTVPSTPQHTMSVPSTTTATSSPSTSFCTLPLIGDSPVEIRRRQHTPRSTRLAETFVSNWKINPAIPDLRWSIPTTTTGCFNIGHPLRSRWAIGGLIINGVKVMLVDPVLHDEVTSTAGDILSRVS